MFVPPHMFVPPTPPTIGPTSVHIIEPAPLVPSATAGVITCTCAAPGVPALPAPAARSTRSSSSSAPSSSSAIDDPPSFVASTAVIATSWICVPLAVLVTISGIASASAVSAVFFVAPMYAHALVQSSPP